MGSFERCAVGRVFGGVKAVEGGSLERDFLCRKKQYLEHYAMPSPSEIVELNRGQSQRN
jgi:hypothetical protein